MDHFFQQPDLSQITPAEVKIGECRAGVLGIAGGGFGPSNGPGVGKLDFGLQNTYPTISFIVVSKCNSIPGIGDAGSFNFGLIGKAPAINQ